MGNVFGWIVVGLACAFGAAALLGAVGFLLWVIYLFGMMLLTVIF